MAGHVVIIMGSKRDLDHVDKIVAQLSDLGVGCTLRVASAHKSVRHLLDLLADAGRRGQGNFAEIGRRPSQKAGEVSDRATSPRPSLREPTVFIAVAGRSNALAGMVDANTVHPVITCPPVSDAFAGADIFSSLRMPSGVAPLVVLDPRGAALAAAKMLALSDPELGERIAAYQAEMTDQVVADDESLSE